MAAWLKPLLLALLAALAFHLLGLIGIGSQMQSTSAVAQKNDPLFTRTIEAASPQADAPPPEPPQPPPATPKRARAVIASAPPDVTSTLAATPKPPAPAPPPEPVPAPAPDLQALPPTDIGTATDISTSTAVASTPTATTETPSDIATVTAITTSTSSQTASAQPAGPTDTLLATGDWPADTRVSYKLTGFYNGELFGDGQVQWTRAGAQGERYQVRVIVDAGLYELRMTSLGRISPDGLLPESFEEYSKRVLANPRIRPLRFEAQELVLQGERRVPRPADQPLAVQDSVSQFIELGHRFTQGRDKLEEGKTVRIWLGRPGGLNEWVYDIGPAETMTLPRIGPVLVHQLKPRPLVTARGTITVSMWLAPSLQYLPAKIRIDLNPQAYAELIAEQFQQK